MSTPNTDLELPKYSEHRYLDFIDFVIVDFHRLYTTSLRQLCVISTIVHVQNNEFLQPDS